MHNSYGKDAQTFVLANDGFIDFIDSKEGVQQARRCYGYVAGWLNYLATHPDHTVTYTACDMILQVYSDASYNSRPGSISIAGGWHYCVLLCQRVKHEKSTESFLKNHVRINSGGKMC